ncbi:MAG: hypothetical protein CMJ87_00125 [Planctomycetes bacterium]|jgi:hypothetical protein|nr:hypothetical protein [Planctomycetota bacterium]
MPSTPSHALDAIACHRRGRRRGGLKLVADGFASRLDSFDFFNGLLAAPAEEADSGLLGA